MTNADITIAPVNRTKFGESRSIAQASFLEDLGVGRLQLVAASVVVVLAYGPLLWLFFRQQWQKPHYQYFPFVIGAFIWLIWKRYREAPQRITDVSAKSWRTYNFLLVAVLLLVFGLAIRSPWCAMVSLILLVASLFTRISTTRRITNLWGIWLLLWLVVPAPLNLDQKLITKLQSVSSRLSSFVLDSSGIQHLMDGNTLWLRSKQLFVDEACSGIISMLSIVACAVIYAVAKNRTPIHLLALAVASVAWSTLLNVVRISAIAYMLDTWAIDWSVGAPHEFLSLALFLVAFLGVLCTDQLLLACLAPIRPVWDESYGASIRFGKRLASAWDRITMFGAPLPEEAEAEKTSPKVLAPASPRFRNRYNRLIAALFAPLAAVQCVLIVYAFQLAPERLPAVQRAMQLGSLDMPPVLCGANKLDFQKTTRSEDNIQGKYSRTYMYQAADGTNYSVSFDFPFTGYWHELTECYVATGWIPVKHELSTAPASKSDARDWKVVEATFDKAGGLYGSLFFSEFDQFGTPFEPESDFQGVSFWQSRYLYLKERQILQVQVWSEGPAELSAEQRQKARELLLAAREHFRALVVPSSSSVNAHEIVVNDAKSDGIAKSSNLVPSKPSAQ